MYFFRQRAIVGGGSSSKNLMKKIVERKILWKIILLIPIAGADFPLERRPKSRAAAQLAVVSFTAIIKATPDIWLPYPSRVKEDDKMAILCRGSKGEKVARLQALLCLAEINAKPIDGDFGSGTERAVRAYQGSKGLPSTGEADEDTQVAVGMNRPDTTKTPVPVIDNITVDIVARMFSRFTPRLNIETYLSEVLAALKQADMDDRDLVLMALATIRAETEGFEPISEKQSIYNTDPGAHPFNKYDNLASLGNHGRPDGERYRGRGFIQLTGRANYQRYGERLGVGSRLIDEPELANDSRVAAQILTEFIKDKRNLAKYAILGHDLRTVRRLVNGGSHGLDRFTEAFETGARLLV